jgi:glycosyltransferase domain-containing protein
MVIPTYDRPEFLFKTLGYLVNVGFPYPVTVCDTTPNPVCDRNKKIVDELSNQLQVDYVWYNFHHFSHRNSAVASSVVQALERFDSKYAVLCADDDYHILSVLQSCVEFLEQHPDYATAHGKILHIAALAPNLKSPIGIPRNEIWAFTQNPSTLFDSDPTLRLGSSLTSTPGTFYAVHRRDNLIRNMEITRPVKYGWFLDPLMSFIDAIQGKSFSMNEIYSVRPYHPHDTGYEPSFRLDITEIMNKDDYNSDRIVFFESIALELQRETGMDIEEATSTTDLLVGGWVDECAKDVKKQKSVVNSIPSFIRVVSHLIRDRKFLGKPYAMWLAASFLTKNKYVPLDSASLAQIRLVIGG